MLLRNRRKVSGLGWLLFYKVHATVHAMFDAFSKLILASWTNHEFLVR